MSIDVQELINDEDINFWLCLTNLEQKKLELFFDLSIIEEQKNHNGYIATIKFRELINTIHRITERLTVSGGVVLN